MKFINIEKMSLTDEKFIFLFYTLIYRAFLERYNEYEMRIWLYKKIMNILFGKLKIQYLPEIMPELANLILINLIKIDQL